MTPPRSGPFNRALDNAVAQQAAAAVEKYCPDCLGTKKLSVRHDDGTWTSPPCQRCELTGLRGASDK